VTVAAYSVERGEKERGGKGRRKREREKGIARGNVSKRERKRDGERE